MLEPWLGVLLTVFVSLALIGWAKRSLCNMADGYATASVEKVNHLLEREMRN